MFAGDARCAADIRAAQAAKVEAVWQLDGGGLDALAGAGEGVTAGEIGRRRALVTAATLATIVYTSGTTGRPKGCMISHGNLTEAVRAVTGIPGVRERVLTDGSSSLFFLPLSHILARVVALCLVHDGQADRFPLRSGRAARGAGRVPPHDPARGAPGVREGRRRGPRAGRSRGPPAAVRRRRGHRDRLQPGRAPGRPAAAAAARGVRPAGLRAAARGAGRTGGLGGQRRRAAEPGAGAFPARGRDHRHGGLGADRDDRPGDHEPARGPEDRLGRPAAARLRRADRTRRRDRGHRTDRVRWLLARPAGHHPGARGPVAAHRRPRPAGRRRVPLPHRQEEGPDHHRGRQERGARGAGRTGCASTG